MCKDTDHYFENKLIIITGGTSGIGLALARELHNRNAKVIVLADKIERVKRTVECLAGNGAAFAGYTCDIGLPESVAGVSNSILTEHGVPDILINNAGFAIYRTLEQEPAEEVERLISVNFAGAIRITKAFLGGMVARRSGHIVNVASIAGVIALTPNGIYSAAKHGMVAWSRCLALELARFGISVTVVCPGRVMSRFFDHETFQQRPHRKETALVIPMTTVVDGILDAVRHRKLIRFVPRYYGIIAWALNALGPLLQNPLNRLLRARVEDLYLDAGR
jgi:short-subunit dehydrogenase